MSARKRLREAIRGDKTLKKGIRDQFDLEQHAGEGELKTLRLDKIILNKHNPRKLNIKPNDIRNIVSKAILLVDGTFGTESYDAILLKTIEEIVDPIAKERLEALFYLAKSVGDQGLIQPISVSVTPDGVYEIIAGERRYLAHLLMGRQSIRAMVREKSQDDISERKLSLIENISREDLNTGEKIDYINELLCILEARTTESINAIALSKLIHESERTCRRYLRYVSAPADIRESIRKGEINSVREIDTAIKNYSDTTSSVVPGKASGVQASTTVRSGRRRTAVSLGKTGDIKVVAALSKALAQALELKELPETNWDDIDSVQIHWDYIIKQIKYSL